MAATIQLIAASPIARTVARFLRPNCHDLSRPAQWSAGIAVAFHGSRSDIMTRLRRFAIAFLAASTVAFGSLALPAPASAMPMSCEVRWALSETYYATAQIFYALGDYTTAFYWVGKSYGIVEGC
jgi:hypothetical protein